MCLKPPTKPCATSVEPACAVLPLAGSEDLAEDDLVDFIAGDLGALEDVGDDGGTELVRRGRCEGTVEGPDGRAAGAGNHHIAR